MYEPVRHERALMNVLRVALYAVVPVAVVAALATGALLLMHDTGLSR